MCRGLAVLAALAVTGCARCDGGGDGSGASGAASGSGAASVAASVAPAVVKVPLPEPWTLATVRGPPGTASPERCRQRGPVLWAKAPVTTHFAVEPRTLGALLVAETAVEPPSVQRAGLLTFDASGKAAASEAAPWPDAMAVPRVGRLGERWLAAWDAAREGSASEVFLYRDGEARSLGVGDAFVAADLLCGEARCALLTSRVGRVAPSGADVVLLERGAAAASAPRTVTIEPEAGASPARPFGLAAIDGARGPVAVLTEGTDAVFWTVDGEAPAPIARVPAEHGLLDATVLRDRPLAMAHGNVVDEQGCAREGADGAGAKVRFQREGEPAREVRTPGAPLLAALRPLAKGALAAWMSPLGCGVDRRVVFAVVLDDQGAPTSPPMAVADGDTFALAVNGADADLWIRRADEIAWMRLTCSPE